MKNYVQTYFSAFKTESNVKNTKVTYDEHCIEFLSDSGSKFNLKFKNKIEKVFSISDGIIIKFVHSSENNFEFFYKAKNPRQPAQNTYIYYVLTQHPLNNISSLNILSNDNISNINIVKVSSRFPFLISREYNKYNIYLLLYKKQNVLEDFNTNMQKIMSQSTDQFNIPNDNYNLIASENNFSLLFLGEVIINLISNYEIKIFTTNTEKNSIYIGFFLKNQNTFILSRFKFQKNNLYSYTKDIFTFKDICGCTIIDSIINPKIEEELFEKYSEISKNKIIRLIEKNKNYFKNKTICLLNSQGDLMFLEGGNILININLYTQMRVKRDISGLKYNKLSNTYNISIGFLKNEVKYSFKFDFFINNDIIVDYFKFFRILLRKKTYLIFLNKFFTIFSNNLDKDRLILFFDFILSIFLAVNKTENNVFNYSYNNSDNYFKFKKEKLFDEIFPLLQNTNQADDNNHNYNNNIDFKNINFENLYIEQVDIKDFLKFIKIEELLDKLLKFSRLIYENYKVNNYYSKEADIIPYFIIKLLIISNSNNSIPYHAQFYNYNYGVIFNKDIFESSSKYVCDSFIDYLKVILNGTDNKSDYSNHFNGLNNIITMFKKIKNIKNEQENTQNKVKNENDFVLFIREKKKENYGNCDNIAIDLLKSKLDVNSIKQMHPFIAFILLNEISKMKANPYQYLTSHQELDLKILKLINRPELAVNNLDKTNKEVNSKQSIEENNPVSSMLYNEQSPHNDSEYYITNIKFNSDTRFKESLRILNPNRIIKVNTSSLSLISDQNVAYTEKFNLIYKSLTRQHSAAIGNGAVNLNTIKTFPKDILIIKSLNLTCLSTTDESTFKLDINSELLKDKQFQQWSEFHNGVSQSLKLSTEYLSNKSYIRNWILFNKPSTANYEHGGLLYGLGLLKQLDSLFSTDIYQYMKTAHDGITIGILLGRAASKLSSMEESLSRTLCLHISYLIPSSLEINIPMTIQCAASVGLGLLYLGTGYRLMTEMLLNQIGKKIANEKIMNINNIEAYNLSLGFSIGLINLGLGKASLNEDLKLEEKLINFANGGKKLDISSNNNDSLRGKSYGDPYITGSSLYNKPSPTTFVEEFEVNTKLTAPAAYACLTLTYLQTENVQVSNSIKIPNNLFQLDNFKSIHIYLAKLAINLINWRKIEANEEWIYSQIPGFIKFLYESTLEGISEDYTYMNKLNNIEFSHIATSYFYALSAAIMSIGIKYSGTNNKTIANLIIKFILRMRGVKVTPDILIKEQNKYNNTNKYFLNKTTLDQCLCICSLALSIVMGGSGDLDSFKILRIIRKKLDSDHKNFNYGHNQAIHQAIGILFLGAGALTFNTSKQSIAFLYISLFPSFASSPNCNDKYLQCLRHFYALACESKILETRDVDTGAEIKTKLLITYQNGLTQEVTTPVNIDDYNVVKLFTINKENYYHTEIKKKDLLLNGSSSDNQIRTKTIYIKKKNLFSNDIAKYLKTYPITDIDNFNLTYELTNNLLNEILIKLRGFIDEDRKNKYNYNNNLDIEVITKILVEQLENIETNFSLGNAGRDFYLIFKKSCIYLLIIYVQSDKINNFIEIYDKLIKLYHVFNNGSKDYNLFKFFQNLNEVKEHVANSKIEKIILMEIDEFIEKYLSRFH